MISAMHRCHCLYVVLFFCVKPVVAQPNFPEGVAPIMRSADLRSAAMPTEDDKSIVAALMTEGESSLADDVADDDLRRDLKQSAYARVHLYVLRSLYAGGCPRNMSSCPEGWLDAGDGCDPPAGYKGLCAGYKGNLSPTQKV